MKKTEKFLERPPVVAVLGHVDHGKTSLLDRIRKTHLAEKEPGGITQSIGAYQVVFKGSLTSKGKEITFIDTPGHAAFSKMRARGGKVADLIVLVVAVDDGVMPQTLESVEHARAAGVPFLVALNKIDLPDANIERVKKQLAQNGILVEGYGGEVVCVPVSAKTGQGLEELLEMIILLAQMQEIKADPEGLLEAIVIESKKGKAGPSGTVIVRNGTLKVGDQILVEEVAAKVRGLMDENGKRLKKADPGKPVEVLGFEVPPPIGAKVTRVEVLPKPSPLFQPSEAYQLPEDKENKLRIILKTDSAGSLEALSGSLSKDILLVSTGIGDIVESDVFLAQTTKAKIFGFKVKVSPSVFKLAETEKVEIKTYDVIYQFLEDLEKEVLQILKPTPEEEIGGKAEIIAEFPLKGLHVAGCRVVKGAINKANKLHLFRGDKLLGEARISSMKRKKETITEAKFKEEFGVLFEPSLDFKVGDMLISFSSKANE